MSGRLQSVISILPMITSAIFDVHEILADIWIWSHFYACLKDSSLVYNKTNATNLSYLIFEMCTENLLIEDVDIPDNICSQEIFLRSPVKLLDGSIERSRSL